MKFMFILLLKHQIIFKYQLSKLFISYSNFSGYNLGYRKLGCILCHNLLNMVISDSMIRQYSDPHKFLVRREIDSPHKKEADPLGIYRFLKLHHSLPLVRSYAP